MLNYSHSIEMSIFSYLDYRGQGVSNYLVEESLEALRGTKYLSTEVEHKDSPVEGTVKKAIAIIAADKTALPSGLTLRK